MTLLSDRLIKVHLALDGSSIEHAFGGAIALAYWTLDPRGTSDIDVNIFVPASDCAQALEALPRQIAVPSDTVTVIERDGQTRLWWDRTPVDVFFDYLQVHAEASKNRRIVPYEDTEIPILGPIELAIFKAMFDRTRDWADIEDMIEAETLDLDAVREELARLVGRDDTRFARLDEATKRADAARARRS